MLTILNNITAILLLFDLLLLAVWLFLKCFDGFNQSILPLFSRLFFWFANRKADEAEVEQPVDEFLSGMYDVEAFRDRIRKLTIDEDGLYEDLPIELLQKDDFTGVEIITETGEIMADEHFWR